MKNFLLSLGVLFFVFGSVSAQLVADAGNDTTICYRGHLDLGGSPSAIGGIPPYTYLWSGPNGFYMTVANPSFNNANAGTYILRVTDNTGSQVTDSITVGYYPFMQASISMNPSYSSACTNTVMSFSLDSISLGFPPYSYFWDFDDGTPTVPLQISQHVYADSGHYQPGVTVTDSLGCTVKSSFVIEIVPSCTEFYVFKGDASCTNSCNGSINLVRVNPGNFHFNWSNGANTQDITDLCPGTYSVTVSDSTLIPIDTLSASIGFYQASTFNVAITSTNVDCNGNANGSAIAVASGGTPPYSYWWITPFSYDSIVDSLSAGMYYVRVYDFAGCEVTRTVTITQPPTLVSNSAAIVGASCGQSNGSASFGVSGGVPPYTYLWSNGFTSTQQGGLSAGVYTITITDSKGCTATRSITITQNCNGFVITTQNSTCFGTCNGSATVNPAGNYRYLWSNTDTSRIITNLCSGTYTVTVSDSLSNPVDTLSITITQPNQMVIPFFTTNVTCAGMSNGSAVLTTGGGTPPYTYLWSNGMTTSVAQNLAAGNYVITVFDANQCSATTVVTIIEPFALSVMLVSTPSTDTALCNGTIDASVNGGTAPYSFLWSNSSATEDISGLCAGTYNVTITDANNCSTSALSIITGSCTNNTINLSITSTGDLDCTRQADTLTANVSGGNPPYVLQWSNGVGNIQSIVTMFPGIYQVWVTDDSGCVKTTAYTVLDFGLHIAMQSVRPVSCNGVSDGKLKVAVSGGQPPYSFLWSNGATTDSIVGVPSGSYYVIVTDAGSCTDSFTYFIPQATNNWSYYVYVNTTQANCSANGSATATVYGGTGPFTYLWNTTPPQTTQTATGLLQGSYQVTVTGSDGCTRVGYASVYGTCRNVVEGHLFNDINGNCVRDSGEVAVVGTSVRASNGNADYYGYTGSDGFYTIRIYAAGTYTITGYPGYGYNSCSITTTCPQTASFTGLGDTVLADVGIAPSTGFDLALHPGWRPANPGFTKEYWILYHQQSQPVYNGTATIVFKYDSILIYQSNTHGGVHNAAARTITWTVSNVPYPSWNWSLAPYIYFTVPANTPLNYQLRQEFTITPTSGDCDTSDNRVVAIQPITGSRDPNAKEVLPAGDIIEDDSVLTYTIHFQNTGNDTTWFVILKDTLSAHVNPATVQNISSSHDYASFDVTDHGILTWVFNPIYLVDSATNEPASKGYVMFLVKKKHNLPLTTEIKNKASIYFDYNEPIVTNTVTNTMTLPNFIFTMKGDENISVTAMPNSFSKSTQIVVEGVAGTFDFELFDVTGKVMKKISSIGDNRFDLDRENMSAGVYFYRITSSSKQRAFGRVVVE